MRSACSPLFWMIAAFFCTAWKRRARGFPPGSTRQRCAKGRPGVLHGSYSYLLQDEHGQVLPAHSISAGLDYPGVGPNIPISRIRDASGIRR